MSFDTDKNNKKIIGSMIKFHRVNKTISQKELAKGICVPSYLSRIENGELLPSEDVISIIFNRLGLVFNYSEEFISNGQAELKLFFEKLNFNEFDHTKKIFQRIEKLETAYITSPLILEYFLCKLARYSCTPHREKFKDTKNILLSSFDLLSSKQKFIYNFYVGIDYLIISQDKASGRNYIEAALTYKENGHCYFWLSYAFRLENNPIKAYDCIKKALDLYLAEGNILSIMDSYEKLAEVYFMLDNYSDAIHYLEMALNIANKMNNNYFIEHLNSIVGWSYYKLNNYDTALKFLSYNTGLVDHRMVIPDSVIESLIYFSQENKTALKISIEKLKTAASLEHIHEDLAEMISKLFNFYMKDTNYLKSNIWEELLIDIIYNLHNLVELKKVFTAFLKEYYIYNRKYKDALYL